ncbi:hypothetical protein U0X36_25780 [Bacillus thuringiensis]|uniref:hypothetical protein n=1 Tax=Bacillus thuringiensis TaxID=1428 RepID=UPI000E4C2466|nr:hypothetical protein [Bacillus thuringiensis]MDZ3956224.1 hypothetical protein [Bacillus thuringiensis]RGP43370.1 hypothetical protein BTW32_29875 [Bacillus thuringiensis]
MDLKKLTFFQVNACWDFYNGPVDSLSVSYLDVTKAIEFAKEKVKDFLVQHDYTEKDLEVEQFEDKVSYTWSGEGQLHKYYISVDAKQFADVKTYQEEPADNLITVDPQEHQQVIEHLLGKFEPNQHKELKVFDVLQNKEVLVTVERSVNEVMDMFLVWCPGRGMGGLISLFDKNYFRIIA